MSQCVVKSTSSSSFIGLKTRSAEGIKNSESRFRKIRIKMKKLGGKDVNKTKILDELFRDGLTVDCTW